MGEETEAQTSEGKYSRLNDGKEIQIQVWTAKPMSFFTMPDICSSIPSLYWSPSKSRENRWGCSKKWWWPGSGHWQRRRWGWGGEENRFLRCEGLLLKSQMRAQMSQGGEDIPSGLGRDRWKWSLGRFHITELQTQDYLHPREQASRSWASGECGWATLVSV